MPHHRIICKSSCKPTHTHTEGERKNPIRTREQKTTDGERERQKKSAVNNRYYKCLE